MIYIYKKLFVGCLVLFLTLVGHAQTATVTAVNDLSCLGDRIGRNGVCTAKEFASVLTFTQASLNALSQCLAGEYVTVNIIADVSGTNTNRYDVAYFIGQTGNLPENLGGQCSVAAFPSSPSPFAELDNAFVAPADQCGDYVGGGVATLQMNSVKILCQPAAGSGQVSVPYTIAWNAQQPYACSASTIIPKPDSKCLSGPASAVLDGLVVQGWVRIVKATVPATATTAFDFTATSPSGVPVSTSGFSLTNGQSQVVSIPMAATTRTIDITETLAAGWEPNATITCVRPDGTPAPFVTVNNATRSISANLLGANNAAICTYTNTKQTRVRTAKVIAPSDATGTFDLSTSNGIVTASASNQANNGSTAYLSTGAVPVTSSESGFGSSNIAHYQTTVSCVNDTTGAAITPSATNLTASTRTATFTPTLYTDNTCTFVNTRAATLSIQKTNNQTSLITGTSTSYDITVTNNGPSSADGAVVSDPSIAALSCTTLSCSSTGSAACPASPINLSTFQSTGLAITSFPPNSSVTFTLACTVN